MVEVGVVTSDVEVALDMVLEVSVAELIVSCGKSGVRMTVSVELGDSEVCLTGSDTLLEPSVVEEETSIAEFLVDDSV